MKHIIILVLLFCTQMVSAAEYGIFLVVKGKVSIQGPNGVTEAKLNSTIQVGETVVTEADSRAKIVMSDHRNIINVAPDTKLKFEKYSNSKEDKNVKLKLIEGKVRSKVGEKYDNRTSKFEIRTATAVAGVRGTDFITSYDSATKTTEIVTFRGEVSFTSLAGNDSEVANGETVLVSKGEKSQSKEGAAASAPAKIPEKELKQIDSDSSVKDKETKDKEAEKSKDDAKKGKKDGKKDAGEEAPPEDTGAINTQPPTVNPALGEVKEGSGATVINRENSKVIINIQQPK